MLTNQLAANVHLIVRKSLAQINWGDFWNISAGGRSCFSCQSVIFCLCIHAHSDRSANGFEPNKLTSQPQGVAVGILLGKQNKSQRNVTNWQFHPIINLKDTFFDTAVGSRPNCARMCGYRPDWLSAKQIDPPHPRGV